MAASSALLAAGTTLFAVGAWALGWAASGTSGFFSAGVDALAWVMLPDADADADADAGV